MPAEALSAASALLPPASHARTLFIAGEDFCSYASFYPAESKTEGEAGARKCFLEPDFEQRKEEQPPAPRSALRAHSGTLAAVQCLRTSWRLPYHGDEQI